MNEEFGLSTDDQTILDRLRTNRDKNNTTKKQKKQKTQDKLLDKDEKQPSPVISKVEEPNNLFPVKTFFHKGSTSPKVTVVDGDVVLSWTRSYIKKNQILVLPQAIELDGMLSLEYHPVTRVLTIKAVEGNSEAK